MPEGMLNNQLSSNRSLSSLREKSWGCLTKSSVKKLTNCRVDLYLRRTTIRKQI